MKGKDTLPSPYPKSLSLLFLHQFKKKETHSQVWWLRANNSSYSGGHRREIESSRPDLFTLEKVQSEPGELSETLSQNKSKKMENESVSQW